MTRATVLQEVRRMRFEELYERRHRRELTMREAAEILGVTERTFRRWSTRYETDGVAGLEDQRLGRASARAVPVDEVLQMVTLYESLYRSRFLGHGCCRIGPDLQGALVGDRRSYANCVSRVFVTPQ